MVIFSWMNSEMCRKKSDGDQFCDTEDEVATCNAITHIRVQFQSSPICFVSNAFPGKMPGKAMNDSPGAPAIHVASG